MKNKDKPAFPIVYQEGRSPNDDGLTKREYAMIHAPDKVPDWFRPTAPKGMKIVIRVADHTVTETSEYSEFKYFQWRKYFAEKILEL